MEKIDYLNMRTTNMNIRISPLLKSALIERGAIMGVNLSDFILHVLTKEMSGESDVELRMAEIEAENQELQDEVKRYEALAEPFKDAIGGTLENGEQTVSVHSHFDILKFITESFKTHK